VLYSVSKDVTTSVSNVDVVVLLVAVVVLKIDAVFLLVSNAVVVLKNVSNIVANVVDVFLVVPNTVSVDLPDTDVVDLLVEMEVSNVTYAVLKIETTVV